MTIPLAKNRLAIAVAKNRSWRGVCRYLILRPSAKMRRDLIAAADEYEIPYDHFVTSHNAGRSSRRSGLVITD